MSRQPITPERLFTLLSKKEYAWLIRDDGKWVDRIEGIVHRDDQWYGISKRGNIFGYEDEVYWKEELEKLYESNNLYEEFIIFKTKSLESKNCESILEDIFHLIGKYKAEIEKITLEDKNDE
jgi:hypothetical protein